MLHEFDRVAFDVNKVHVHKNWNPTAMRFNSDIALLILSDKVPYNDHIQPICVTLPNTPEASATSGTIIGYGKTEYTSRKFSHVPKQSDVSIHDLKTCIQKFPNIQPIAYHTTFCVKNENVTGTGCTGNSGDGLIVRIGRFFYLRGIQSATFRDSEHDCNPFSLYTDITQFIPWIGEINAE